MAYAAIYAAVGAFVLILILMTYISLNDAAITRIPARVLELSPEHLDKADFEAVAKRMDENPVSIEEHLPPKTGRRYIVVGGSGFLGGWIVVHLLKRGEPPSNIRVVDLRSPTRLDFQSGLAKQIQFVQADISNAEQVEAAFKAAWPATSTPNSEITVFHTAAVIRFTERHPSFLPLSRINVVGTENIINASRAAGASILIYTSSGSVSQRNTRLLLIPWLEKEPKNFVQVLRDEEPSDLPKTLDGFTSCYSYTKLKAETMVRKADRSLSGPARALLRTGCLRPSNGIYGPGADLWEYILNKGQNNISLIPNIMTGNIYVENCSFAHLCYERRLIDLASGGTNLPDIGGQMFTVTDSEKPVFWITLYNAISHFTNGKCQHKLLAPTIFILASYVLEQYNLAKHYLSSSTVSALAFAGKLLPRLPGDLHSLQPSMLILSHTHLFVDDSRARRPPSKGGLGYKAPWSALEGLYKTVKQFETEGSLRPAASLQAAGFGHGK